MDTKLVIFDLDGTLLNTIADLAASTNYALRMNGFPERRPDEYPFFVGNGIMKLFERALPEEARTEENLRCMREQFLFHYDRHNSEHTEPYKGIPELLEALKGAGIGMAVASNKYQAATEALVRRFFPDIPFRPVFGQRTGIPVKPDPAVVREILSLTGVPKDSVLYVGDSGVDMQTAAAAGVKAVGVLWGFRPQEELEAFRPAWLVRTPAEIAGIIGLKAK